MLWFQAILLAIELLAALFTLRCYRLASAGEGLDKTTPVGRWAWSYLGMGLVGNYVVCGCGAVFTMMPLFGPSEGLVASTLGRAGTLISIGFVIVGFQYRRRSKSD